MVLLSEMDMIYILLIVALRIIPVIVIFLIRMEEENIEFLLEDIIILKFMKLKFIKLKLCE